MKNSDLWNQYKEYTQELTGNCRKLAFAAGALCWFFKSPEISFPPAIINALGFVVAFFVADILQCFFAVLLLGTWTRRQEKKMWKEKQTIEGEYDKPSWLDYPAFTLWSLKTLFLLLAYVFIAVQLLRAEA